MNEEMLQEEVIESVDDTQVDDSPEITESAEVAPKNDDFVEFNPEQQKRFNKEVWEKNEAIRKAKKLEEELERARLQREQAAPQPEPTSQASMPDPDLNLTDPDAYKQQLDQWQRNVLEQAKLEAAQAAKSLVNETQTKAQQEAQQKAQQELVNGYAERAIKSGLDAQKLIDAENVFTAYNPNPDLVDFILTDQNGPHLMNYLASNQSELESLVSMPPMRAALHLEKLRDKALNANKGTKAPDPIEPLGGRAAVDELPATIRGATFE